MNSIKAKSIGSFSVVYGIGGASFGLFALLMTYAQQKMMGNFRTTGDHILKMKSFMAALQSVWLIYMPLMIAIGLIYIFSGFLLNKENKKGISVGIYAAILNLLWFVAYLISVFFTIVPVLPHSPGHLGIIFGAMGGIVMALYPLYFLLTFRRIDFKRGLNGMKRSHITPPSTRR